MRGQPVGSWRKPCLQGSEPGSEPGSTCPVSPIPLSQQPRGGGAAVPWVPLPLSGPSPWDPQPQQVAVTSPSCRGRRLSKVHGRGRGGGRPGLVLRGPHTWGRASRAEGGPVLRFRQLSAGFGFASLCTADCFLPRSPVRGLWGRTLLFLQPSSAFFVNQCFLVELGKSRYFTLPRPEHGGGCGGERR